MKLIHGLGKLPNDWQHCVLTVGNFDGVHKGHQALISRCVALAKQHQTRSVVMTFEPYPQVYFSHNDRFPRLMNLRDKFLALQALGVDDLLVLPFNATLSQLSAEDFIQKILLDHLKIKAIVIGDDFRFGANRAGDFDFLTAYASRHHFAVFQMPTLVYEGERVSSSQLREALSKSDLALAEAFLGQHYCLSGRVMYGDRRGIQFGFPTANVLVSQKKLPLSGIFAVEVHGLEGAALPGVASVGYRPMYPTESDVVEVHLLNFNKNIYKKHCTVTFLKYLRDEMNFSSEAELIQQIENDVSQASMFFGMN